MAQVQVINAQNTSGGQGPGIVTVPEAEADALVAAGYAVRIAAT